MIIQTEKGQEARRLFESGYNCAQSVAGAFAEEMGLPRDTVFRLASPFGGGMGRMREVCGAVSGMMMVLGILDGYCSPTDLPEKKRVYQTVQELAGEFRAGNGSIICHELLGTDGKDTNAVPSERTPQYYKKRPCACYVADAANILGEYLKQKSHFKL